jgi:RNA polymerase sigma factor (sigma-70 family)
MKAPSVNFRFQSYPVIRPAHPSRILEGGCPQRLHARSSTTPQHSSQLRFLKNAADEDSGILCREILVARFAMRHHHFAFMSSQSGEQDEHLQLRRFHEGDPEALGWIRNRFHPALMNILMARGASRSEAEELLSDLWGDCVPGDDERPSLLEKFSGKCALQSWLATVATRRWIDLKRKQSRRREVTSHDTSDSEEDVFARMESSALLETPSRTAPAEEHLIDLLRESLQSAFDQLPAGDLLMLRLVYLHGLSQRDVGRMWTWHESKISRRLADAMKNIQTLTLEHLRKKDAWLNLTWQDFVDLCETHQVGFL